MTTKSVFSADFNQQDVIAYLDNAFGKNNKMKWEPYVIDDAANFRKDADAANIDKALRIGEYPNRIKVYDITLKPNCHIACARVGIKRLVTQLMDNYSYAILLFHYEDTANTEWRISWVTRGGSSNKTNAAKRYTFLCGAMHPVRTIVDRLSQISTSKGSVLPDKITEAFSVETLSDAFFDEYKAFYEDIVQYICGVRYVKEGNKYVRKEIESKTTIEQRGIFEMFKAQAVKENPKLLEPITETNPEKREEAEKKQKQDKIDAAEKLVRDYVKKLLGRLVFIQFIAKKGWMGLKPTDAWGAGNEHFLLNLYKNASQQDKNDFVQNILKSILFDSLNNNPNGKTDHLGVKVNVKTINAIDYKFPYLNGGLFEETALDNLGINIPGYFFVSNEKDSNGRSYGDDDKNAPKNTPRKFVEVAKKKSKKKNSEEIENTPYPYSASEGLFEFFERYNFTIDENDSDEAVVGIDPEMLGKIFENLLEDNKDKGAFYTPKPVVEYMCQQSLIAYLQNGVLNPKSKSSDKSSDNSQKVDIASLSAISVDEIKAQIEQFVKTKSLPFATSVESRQGLGEVGIELGLEKDSKSEKNTTEKVAMSDALVDILNQLLKDVKICDPAIGSGAFPMGLLNELLGCRLALAERLIKNSKGNMVLDDWGVKPTDEQLVHLRAELKKEIIQNNIYGVDIEEGAIEIARLRFWLSIVIDLDRPEPLPNFDFKFMQGNSLIEQYEGIDLSNIVAMKKKRKCEVSCDLFGKVEGIDKDTLYLSDTMFEFDLQKTINDYFNISDHNEKQKKKSEIDEYLKCVICHTLSVKAVELNGTISNLKAVDNLKPKQQKVLDETENEYNRLQDIIKNFHSAICDKFFLWHLWFKNVFDNGGFDIVIGNPPYFQMPKGVVDVKKYPYSEGKDQGKQNIYKLFIELAYNLLRENGVNSFITQSSLMCDASSQYTRELLLKETTLYQVIEFPQVAPHKGGQLFKEASVATCIYLYAKITPIPKHKFKLSDNNDLTTLYHFDFAELQQSDPLSFYPNGYCFPLIRNKQFGIVEKMNRETTHFSEYLIENSQGDFNLSTEKKHYGANATSVKVYRGCHVHKYYIDKGISEYAQEGYKSDKVQNNVTLSYLVCQGICNLSLAHRVNFSVGRKEKCLYGHSVNKVRLTPNCDIYMMLGILNSKPIDWYFRRTSTNNNINSYELEQLPIPSYSAAQQQEIIDIVDKILSAKKQNPAADTTSYERQIDALVYELYGITSYEELLEIEGDKDKALQMLVLMTIHQQPNSTEALVIKQLTPTTDNPPFSDDDIQTALAALKNEGVVSLNCNQLKFK